MSTKNSSESDKLATRDQAGHSLGSVEKQLLKLPRDTARLIIHNHLSSYQQRHQQMLNSLIADVTPGAAGATREAVEELGWIELDPAVSF